MSLKNMCLTVLMAVVLGTPPAMAGLEVDQQDAPITWVGHAYYRDGCDAGYINQNFNFVPSDGYATISVIYSGQPKNKELWRARYPFVVVTPEKADLQLLNQDTGKFQNDYRVRLRNPGEGATGVSLSVSVWDRIYVSQVILDFRPEDKLPANPKEIYKINPCGHAVPLDNIRKRIAINPGVDIMAPQNAIPQLYDRGNAGTPSASAPSGGNGNLMNHPPWQNPPDSSSDDPGRIHQGAAGDEMPGGPVTSNPESRMVASTRPMVPPEPVLGSLRVHAPNGCRFTVEGIDNEFEIQRGSVLIDRSLLPKSYRIRVISSPRNGFRWDYPQTVTVTAGEEVAIEVKEVAIATALSAPIANPVLEDMATVTIKNLSRQTGTFRLRSWTMENTLKFGRVLTSYVTITPGEFHTFRITAGNVILAVKTGDKRNWRIYHDLPVAREVPAGESTTFTAVLP